jgi:two-component system CheB/CheR fusion protein
MARKTKNEKARRAKKPAPRNTVGGAGTHGLRAQARKEKKLSSEMCRQAHAMQGKAHEMRETSRARKKGGRVLTAGHAQNDAVAADGHAPDPAAGGDERKPLVVVGIGASAGGLEALNVLLEHLQPEPGLALVLVQHLSPRHESALPDLLSGRTKMPVIQATEGTEVEANHLYIIPPNAQMGIKNGRLHLLPRPEDRTQYTPIDYFFRSLAEDAGTSAIGCVLSGTSSDGALGLREIKAAGGIAIAQEPGTAKYDGMPRAAIATAAVDLVLPPERIAAELGQFVRHPFLRVVQPRRPGDDLPVHDDKLQRVCEVLRQSTGVDFTHYKAPTIRRRLQRRMVLQKIGTIDQYIKLLRESPGEVQSLYRDILIHVTRFFREPETFEALAKYVFPKITENRRPDNPIRIWVPGCSTGEEAYSLGIALLEFLGDKASGVRVQIFATDVSEATVEYARSGIYHTAIESDVSRERLRRFFTKLDGSYRVSKSVRDMCVFARQDLTRDPPFSHLDLIICRNVLIYMGAALQKRLLSLFRYALRNTGYLVLGAAETVGPGSEMFASVEKKHRIYTASGAEPPPGMHFPVNYAAIEPQPGRRAPMPVPEVSSVQKEATRIVLERFSPPGVLVDNNLHILEFRGQTGRYLEPAPGEASLNLLKMAREGLLYGLRTVLHEARKKNQPMRKDGLRVRVNGDIRPLSVEVIPLAGGAQEGRYFLVLFDEDRRAKPIKQIKAPEASPPAPRGKRERGSEEEAATAKHLQEELRSTREYMQSIIQDLEAANEELQSANEEILSSNEELQSTNEELDTAKEELQSTNEELNTLNEELHSRNDELSRVNSDLTNLLGSVQIAIVMVSADLRIRRFTPMAEKILNVIPGDVGRPIGQIKPNIKCPDLEELIRDSIDHVVTREREVQDNDGNWFSLRVRPYKTVENRIDGAVLVLFDITDARGAQAEARAGELSRAIISTVREPLVVLEDNFRIWSTNRSFSRLFNTTPEEVKGKLLSEVGGPAWGDARLRSLLEEVLPQDKSFEDFELVQETGDGQKVLVVNGRRVEPGERRPAMILLAMEEAEGESKERKGK